MFKIIKKERLNPTVTKMVIDAPFIAKKAEPGQFIILRVDEKGERIPLTVADFDREAGTVTIIFQIVGATTENPFPDSPARAASTAALSANILVWNAISSMVFMIVLICVEF